MTKRKTPAAKSAPPTLVDATATKPPAARQYPAPKYLPRAKGGGSPSWTVGDGATLDAVARLQKLFDDNSEQMDSNSPDGEALDMAVAYWLCYPAWLEQVGYWWAGDETRHAAYNSLNKAHHRATELLMTAAEKMGIKSTPLMESAQWCRQLLAEPEIYRATGDIWPTCLEASRDSLPPGAWKAAQKGYATLARLSVKIGPDTPREIAPAESATGGEAGSGVARRNVKFLEWHKARGSDTFRSHATIRDKWNALSILEREKICPTNPQKLHDGERGRQAVIQAIKRAKKANGREPAKGQKRPPQKRAR